MKMKGLAVADSRHFYGGTGVVARWRPAVLGGSFACFVTGQKDRRGGLGEEGKNQGIRGESDADFLLGPAQLQWFSGIYVDGTCNLTLCTPYMEDLLSRVSAHAYIPAFICTIPRVFQTSPSPQQCSHSQQRLQSKGFRFRRKRTHNTLGTALDAVGLTSLATMRHRKTFTSPSSACTKRICTWER